MLIFIQIIDIISERFVHKKSSFSKYIFTMIITQCVYHLHEDVFRYTCKVHFVKYKIQ